MVFWKWLKRYHFKIFLIYSSGSPFVHQSGTNYARGPYEEHFCEIILNLEEVIQKEKHSENIVLIYNSSGCFVLYSDNICAIMLEGL